MTDELNNLKVSIDDIELNRAKNILKMNILMAMERSEDRLEEIARNFMTFGDLTFQAEKLCAGGGTNCPEYVAGTDCPTEVLLKPWDGFLVYQHTKR